MITIIIPIYKKEKYLQQCLENIKDQNFKKWHVIIVNDGSDQPKLIEEITSNSLTKKQYKIIHQNNRGLSSARNTGIKAANTKYVMSLDTDDLLHKDFLYEVMNIFENEKSDIVYSWTQFQGKNNFILDTKKVTLFNLLRGNLITCVSPFQKKVWTTIGGFDESMKNGHEDWEFWIRACLEGFKFSGINKVLFYYNVSDEGLNTGATIKRVENIHYIRKKHRDVYSTSLYSLFKNPSFRETPTSSLLWFWLTNLFFHYVPKNLRNWLFEIYRTSIQKHLKQS